MENKARKIAVKEESDGITPDTIVSGVSQGVNEHGQIKDQLDQNLKDLLETQRLSHIGTWRLNLQTNQVVWSEELYRMYGLDSALPPPPYTEHMKLFTAESWNRLSAALEKTRTSGIPYDMELETVTKDGSNGWMWVRGEAERDAEGCIISIWGAAQDITQRKKVESDIRSSEERFQQLFNRAPLGYQSLDSEGRFIDVNQKWLDTLGYTKEEVIGRWFGDFLCPEYVEGFRKRFPIFKSQGFIHSEFEMLTKDKEKLFIAFDGKIGYDADGAFKQTHCILQDITNQRRAEKALQESEERYKCLFDNSGVGIVYYTTEGVIISYNRKAQELFGAMQENYAGRSISEIFSPNEVEKLFKVLALTLESDQAQEFESAMVFDSGPKWLASTASKVTNAAGEIIGVQIAALDITEKKQAEAEMIYQSSHDYLTDVYNRKFFEEELKRIDIAENLPLSIIIFDINGLKLINDSFGHACGDKLLVEAAKAIKNACGADVIVSRIGGDEFAVLLPNTDAEKAALLARSVKKLASKIDVANIELSISYGYDTKTIANQKTNELLGNAENHLYRHKLYESSSARSKTIEIIMNTLFEKSDRESQHSNRVSSICKAIATEMNFDKGDVNKIGIIGLVHDIGKIGIDEKILNKDGSLSADEWLQIKRHPDVGWRILSSASEFSEIAKFILYHHEKWDGSGYPVGLKGEEIPVEARIITLADAFDAMTTDRSYRTGISREEAIKELKRCSGTHFDPAIVEVFINKVAPFDVAI